MESPPAANPAGTASSSGGKAVVISQPSAYVEALRDAKVLRAAEREQEIRKALDAATRNIPGARWREDKPLLETVVNLTEFPSAILGSFDPEFLELPEEVLVTVMRDHQKYFAVEDVDGKLRRTSWPCSTPTAEAEGLSATATNGFCAPALTMRVFLADGPEADPAPARRLMLQRHLPEGSGQLLRQDDARAAPGQLAGGDRKQSGIAVRPGVVHKAALLAKTDLTTELVKEFTELQGIVGGLYPGAATRRD